MMSENPFDTRFREYDAWFDTNANVFASELLAVRELLPKPGRWIEVGVGSGRFAEALGIPVGVEPAEGIASLARERGVEVVRGRAEALPLEDGSVDALFLITSLCFVREMERAFVEAARVLVPGGEAIVAFLPSDSPFGALYTGGGTDDPFFARAFLRPRAEVIDALQATGLTVDRAVHTLTTEVVRANDGVEAPSPGWERGSFVVVRAVKGSPPSEDRTGERRS